MGETKADAKQHPKIKKFLASSLKREALAHGAA
jgi:hypothetical protein